MVYVVTTSGLEKILSRASLLMHRNIFRFVFVLKDTLSKALDLVFGLPDRGVGANYYPAERLYYTRSFGDEWLKEDGQFKVQDDTIQLVSVAYAKLGIIVIRSGLTHIIPAISRFYLPIGWHYRRVYSFRIFVKRLKWCFSPTSVREEAVVLLGTSNSDNYYHFLTEVFYDYLYAKDRLSAKKVKFLALASGSVWQRAAVNLLGLDIGFIDEVEPNCTAFRFKRLYWVKREKGSALSCPSDQFQALNLLSSSIWNNEKIIRYGEDKMLFISRDDAPSRRLTNESQLCDLLEGVGFKVRKIRFSDYTFEQQIRICCQYRTVIGTHGAGMTNFIFANENVKLFDIHPDLVKPSPCFELLYRNSKIQYIPIIIDTSLTETIGLGDIETWELSRNSLATVIELVTGVCGSSNA